MYHDIDVWLRPGVQLLDVAGPLDVFSSATRYCQAVQAGPPGHRGYRIRLCASTPGPVPTAAGVQLTAETPTSALLRRRSTHATLLIPGDLDDPDLKPDADLLRCITRWPGRIASICAAAWQVARSGRLDGKRATTHWLIAPRLAAAFPTIEVEQDALWIRDGDIWTSAGVSAGIDLALAIVEEDLGREVALEVARLLVLYMKRPGGQSQFSSALRGQYAPEAPLRALTQWMHDHPDGDLRVDALARRAGMSPRNFARVFAQQFEQTPAQVVLAVRLEAARRLLEDEPSASVADIARRSGHGTTESLRRNFQRTLGIGPSAYRERFGRQRPHKPSPTTVPRYR